MFECACCKTSLRLNEELRTPNRISSTSVVSIHMFRSALKLAYLQCIPDTSHFFTNLVLGKGMTMSEPEPRGHTLDTLLHPGVGETRTRVLAVIRMHGS